MAIVKQDILELIEQISPDDLEAAYWAIKSAIDHDESWYWTKWWQQEEAEADQEKANGQQIGPRCAAEDLSMIDW